MKFFKKIDGNYRSYLFRRAWEMKKAAEKNWNDESSLCNVNAPPIADWGACVKESWAEFKDESAWVTNAEAIEMSGYSDRELRRMYENGQIIAVVAEGRWMVNRGSLELFIDSLDTFDPNLEYVPIEEYAAMRGVTDRAVRWQFQHGKVEGVRVKGKTYIAVGGRRAAVVQ